MANCCKGKELYPHLLSPIRIGNVRLKNRIIGAPTSPSMATQEGYFTPEMIAYLGDRASGGAAVVTYGEAIPHGATGKSHNKQVVLDSFGVRQGLSESVRLIHSHNCLANIQLSHGGMYGGLASVGGDKGVCEVAYGPSEMDMPAGHVYEMPKDLIYEIVESYKNAAKLCKEVGYDMVQVHIAHGWMHNQFLSPLFNHRTDEFGGSLENRARMVMLTLDAVREGVGRGFPIELRMNGDDMVEGGVRLEDYIELAQMFEDKIDFFNISVGNHEDPAMFCRTHPSAFFPRGINVQFAAAIKKHVKKPVACVGSLIHPAQMEEIIASGQADMIEIGRGMFADPAIAGKALAGEADDITPCLRCYECFGNTMSTEMARCTVNPYQGLQVRGEDRSKIKAEVSKKVLVVGGGPAGMETAIVAANRGHDVTLVEKSDKLGGNLLPAGSPFFKADIHELNDVLKRRVAKAGVKVLLNTEATPDYIKEFAPDALVIAIGSKEFILPVPGIDKENVLMAIDAELHPEKLGKRVAIMGGGLVGSEIAVSFASQGHEVSIIEMRPDVAIDTNPFYRGGLMPEVQKSAKLYVNTLVKGVVDNGVLVEKDGEQFVIEADTVVCAVGFRAPFDKVDELAAACDEYYIIGDCKKVAQIGQAMDDGYEVGCSL